MHREPEPHSGAAADPPATELAAARAALQRAAGEARHAAEAEKALLAREERRRAAAEARHPGGAEGRERHESPARRHTA